MFFWFKTEGPPHKKIVHSFKESSSSKNQIHRWSSEESCLDYNIYHSHCILYLFKFLANRKKLIFVPGRWGAHANGKQTWDEKLANNCMCYTWPNCAFMLGKVNCLHCTVGFIFFFYTWQPLLHFILNEYIRHVISSNVYHLVGYCLACIDSTSCCNHPGNSLIISLPLFYAETGIACVDIVTSCSHF